MQDVYSPNHRCDYWNEIDISKNLEHGTINMFSTPLQLFISIRNGLKRLTWLKFRRVELPWLQIFKLTERCNSLVWLQPRTGLYFHSFYFYTSLYHSFELRNTFLIKIERSLARATSLSRHTCIVLWSVLNWYLLQFT